MKFALLFVFIAAILAMTFALPAKSSTQSSFKKKACIKNCGDDYAPVCGGDGSGKKNLSFGSKCVLENYNCEKNGNLRVVSAGECPGGQGIRLS